MKKNAYYTIMGTAVQIPVMCYVTLNILFGPDVHTFKYTLAYTFTHTNKQITSL